ncbi:MAG: DUF4982 domain-containing protein [Labilibaculum sp.]|nr:DUF4982 domain-containing protein [Labilibaculum sp.]
MFYKSSNSGFLSTLNRFFAAFLFIFMLSCQSKETGFVRSRASMDFDWKFTLGDPAGVEELDFNDSGWRVLDVPHDWSIEGDYNKNNPSGIAGAFLPTGIGWYRKAIKISKLCDDDKYFIEFDGVYMNSDVWINGHHLGNRPYGYISFAYDLTPYLTEGKNILAVRVDHSKVPSGRWYTGSGIYRHVWLTQTKNIYIPQWGLAVSTPKVDKEEALVNLNIQVKNETGTLLRGQLTNVVYAPNGQKVAETSEEIELGKQFSGSFSLNVNSPVLWSPDQPAMYNIETQIRVKGKIVDTYTTPFGIRSIEVCGSKGFFLNGKSVKFKGLSNHHDAGAVGAAVPDDVLYRRLKLLKEMGCNALRTTHNPYSPEFYNMCDTMGFMVLNEAFDGWWKPKAKHDYGNFFKDWWKTDLADFVHRDQNHPSVVMWSIGNEVPGFPGEQQKTIVSYLRSLDNTRPVTQARGYKEPYADIAGFNGHGEFKEVLEKYHENYPNKAIIGTEITHTLQTRGIYRTKTWYRTKDNPAPWEKPEDFAKMEDKVYKIKDLSKEEIFNGITHKYQSSYDNSIVRIGVRDDWNRVEQNDYYLGNFRWTGFDYLGESFGWPARTANFGIIDLAGFPKDHYYLYQSLWSSSPMVHILPHWTHLGKEGKEIPVVVYTNCESAELFMNGKSLGEKQMGQERQLVWMVPYEKGVIEVNAKTNGEILCSKKIETAEAPAQVTIFSDKKTVCANRTDVIHFEITITDKKGVMVPYADNLVEFEVSGPAKLLGVENGDILDLSPHKVYSRATFNGKCLLMLQTTNEPGLIQVKATSGNLKSSKVMIESFE